MSCSAIFILDLKGNVTFLYNFVAEEAVLKYLERYDEIDKNSKN